MAKDDVELIEEDIEMVAEAQEDNAKAFTSAIVIGTTGVLLVSLIVMLSALGRWFQVGPLA